MKNFCLILVLCFFCACSSKDNTIPLFNNLVFYLNPGEKLRPITLETKNNFFSYFSKQDQALPLYKHVNHKDYAIYLGIPVNSSVQNLLNSPLSVNDSSLFLFNSDSTSYIYRKYRHRGAYLTEFVKNFDSNMIYMLCVTRSKKSDDSLFTPYKINGRINIQ